MSTSRNAVIFFGYSLPVDFELAEKLEKEDIDVLVDGMCGEYFLVGTKMIDVAFDDYENIDETPPIDLSIPEYVRTKVTKTLKKLIPNHKVAPRMYYVTHWY